MGTVHFSIDVSLVEALKRALPLEIFVETGTFKGDGIQKVSGLFQELYTVECLTEYYERACERFGSEPAVHVFQGSSPEFLSKLMPRLAGRSILYWLDAHWCELASDVSPCPLLDELAAIGHLNEQSVLLIDDARLFLTPPPPHHSSEQWPSLDRVLKGLRSLSTAHEILVLNDVIIYFPSSISNGVRDFASRCGIDWLTVLDKARDYDDVLEKFKEQDADVKRLNRLLEEQTRSLEERYADIKRLNRLLEEQDADVKRLNRLLEEQDADIKRLNRLLEEQDADVKRLNRLLEEQARLLEERYADIKRLNRLLEEQDADIKRLLHEMRDLRRSSSYRLGFVLLNPWSSITQKLLKKS